MSKEKFLKAYANLPEPERSQVIVVMDNKPYSWNAAYNEILNNTALGKKMLEKMEVLGIL
ncbi:hypothetical protein HYW20_04250 [Candidatus Woesearchaeota archaeon]|nr:hypothetical protein [Candidatus Woesearchaeota archaeon]